MLFCVTWLDFLKVVLPGRVKYGGMEGEIVVAHVCRKRKKLICGTEGEIVVAHGRLTSPTRSGEYKSCSIGNYPFLGSVLGNDFRTPQGPPPPINFVHDQICLGLGL